MSITHPTPADVIVASAEKVEAYSAGIRTAIDKLNEAINELEAAGMTVSDMMRVMTLAYGQILCSGGVPREVLVAIEHSPIGSTALRGYDYMHALQGATGSSEVH